jgi:hypothetical protein
VFSHFFRSRFQSPLIGYFGVSSYSLLSTLFQFFHTIHNVLKHTLGSFLQFLLFLCLDHSGLHSLLYHVIPLIGPNYARPDETPPAWDERILSSRRDRHQTRRKSFDAKLLNLSRVFGGCFEATAPRCSNINLACRVRGARERVQASSIPVRTSPKSSSGRSYPRRLAVLSMFSWGSCDTGQSST